jgi:cytochrome c-type biogenesis protein CcmH/NrfG
LELFWLLAGVLITLAALLLLLPWLRTIPRLGPLPTVPWQGAVGAAIALALVVGIYLRFGRPELLGASAGPVPALTGSAPTGASTSAANKAAAGSMNSAIAGLEARLSKGSGTADDWELLAKSFEFLGRPDDAAKARAHQLPPLPPAGMPSAATAGTMMPAASAPQLTKDSQQWLAKASADRKARKLSDAAAIYAQLASRDQLDADGWADYADTAASLQGNKLAGPPSTYIDRALAIDPAHPKALWLKASAAEELGQYGAAVALWQRLQATLVPDSADAKIVAANLQAAQKLSGATPSATPMAPLAATGAIAVSGEVALAAALDSRALPGTTLFIVAKSVDSPGMPVAVYRSTVGAWPVKFKLDDSQAMMPGRNLSSAGRITVEARISRTGQAMPAPGDLQGSSGIVNPAQATPLKILIDKVIS